MKIVYPVIFTQTHDEKDTYLIEIPDISGLTEGYGLADAINMARDYIGGACYEKDDADIPQASTLDQIDIARGEFSNAGKSFVSMVDIDLDEYRRKMENRAVRRNVSIPAWLNQAVEREHINVSRVLQEALMEKINVAQ
jgi:predicted RNase H-like HicB family nuclease